MALRPSIDPDDVLSYSQLQYKIWVVRIVEEGINLTDWEDTFIMEIESMLRAGGKITSRRHGAIIERIYTDRVP